MCTKTAFSQPNLFTTKLFCFAKKEAQVTSKAVSRLIITIIYRPASDETIQFIVEREPYLNTNNFLKSFTQLLSLHFSIFISRLFFIRKMFMCHITDFLSLSARFFFTNYFAPMDSLSLLSR